jgi:hypothetical protein
VTANQQVFSSRFTSQFSFGQGGELTGRFGLNVLDDLIAGIDEFQAAAAARRSSRDLGPAMLGAFGWLSDRELLQRIAEYPHACVTFTKEQRPFPAQNLARLRATLARCPGFPARALPGLETLAHPHEPGQPQGVGPYASLPQLTIKGLRTVGYRKTSDTFVPLLHAKLVLLGDLRWQDEDEPGLPADFLVFRPRRLWIGSANGTAASRFSLEFGCWQTEPELLTHAQEFLTQVIAHSEDLDPDADTMEPELVEIEFDDEAMAEALAEVAQFMDEGDMDVPHTA